MRSPMGTSSRIDVTRVRLWVERIARQSDVGDVDLAKSRALAERSGETALVTRLDGLVHSVG
ncbi:hypothetical protein [Saccharothrix longispora]|uniref:hypothetical protein n=1 Tax=Saccharothrix longispora TaxID=33920 RepID=UPI0028FD6453|nr:hypothetical protein [Saccharothrix longispora]MDU0290438.1 hypothetical protein [Saccharothrix longispora]